MMFAARGLAAENNDILGVKLPQVIYNALPQKPLNYLRLADAVVQLEREADLKQLPQSPLALGKGQSLASLVDSLYQFALPRLVALIDRSETLDLDFADKAGELLAELHQSQHELPEALLLQAFGSAQPETNNVRFLVQPEPQSTTPVIIFQPGVPTSAASDDDVPVDISQPPFPNAANEQGAAPQDAPIEPDDRERPISRARDYASLKEEYGRLYRKLELRPQFAAAANWHVHMMKKSRSRYERVEAQTGVPWYFIAVTHGLEASFNFRAHLHNGDYPLTAKTRQVPAGRPTVWLPPSDWESSAKDAMLILGYTGQKDWSLERTLYRLEAYNGLGYRKLGVPTPYLWSFSNHYERGKFVADGRFSNNAKSQQCGAAVMLKLLDDAGEIKLVGAG
jgi:lysozyme family protein